MMFLILTMFQMCEIYLCEREVPQARLHELKKQQQKKQHKLHELEIVQRQII